MEILRRFLVRKWLLGVFALVIVFISVGFIDHCVRCKADGLSHTEALKLANWKIDQQFKKNQPSIKLINERFENKVWFFEYQDKNCITDLIVDQCGVIDNGGVSSECKMNSSYDRQH